MTTRTVASSWFATIATAYGVLHNFSDAPSIRNMLRLVNEQLAELDETTSLLVDHLDVQAEWIADTAPQRHLLLIQQHALEQWLISRGLTL